MSLSVNGHNFEYIVAAKPEGAQGGNNEETLVKKTIGKIANRKTPSKSAEYAPVNQEEMENQEDQTDLENQEDELEGTNSSNLEVFKDKFKHNLSAGSTSIGNGSVYTSRGNSICSQSGLTSGITSGNISEREEV